MKPSRASKELLSSFNSDGKTFSHFSPEGNLVIYNTENGQEKKLSVGENNVSTVANDAGYVFNFSWAKTKEPAAESAVLFGSSSGHVSMWNIVDDKVVWTSKEKLGAEALAFSSTAQRALVAARKATTDGEPVITVMSLEASKKKGKKDDTKACTAIIKSSVEVPVGDLDSKSSPCLIVSPDERQLLVAAGSHIHLLESSTLTTQVSFNGLKAPVCAAAFVPGAPLLLTAAAGESQLSLWRLDGGATVAAASATPLAQQKRKSKGTPSTPPPATSGASTPATSPGPLATLELEEPVICLDVLRLEGSDGVSSIGADDAVMAALPLTFLVAVITASGASRVYRCTVASTSQANRSASKKRGVSSKAVIQAKAQVLLKASVTAGSPDAEAILAAKLKQVFGKDSAVQLLLARGPASLGISFDVVPVPLSNGEVAAPTVLELASRVKAAEESSAVTHECKPSAASASFPTISDEDEVPNFPAGEALLGSRVRHVARILNGSVGVASTAGADSNDVVDGKLLSAEAEDNDNDEETPVPHSDLDGSLSVLLTRAIRSNDVVLLERCFGMARGRGRAAHINQAVAHVVGTDAALFLRAAVDRLLARPAAVSQMAPWVRAVLHFHTGHLMAMPSMRPVLTTLIHAIDTRVALQGPLLKTVGRLSIILGRSSGATANASAVALNAFDDADEEEPEAEDAHALRLGEEEDGGGDEDDEASEEGENDESAEDDSEDDSEDDGDEEGASL